MDNTVAQVKHKLMSNKLGISLLLFHNSLAWAILGTVAELASALKTPMMMIQEYFTQLKATQEVWLWPHRPDSSPKGVHDLGGGQRCCHEMADGEKCELEKASEGAQSNPQVCLCMQM